MRKWLQRSLHREFWQFLNPEAQQQVKTSNNKLQILLGIQQTAKNRAVSGTLHTDREVACHPPLICWYNCTGMVFTADSRWHTSLIYSKHDTRGFGVRWLQQRNPPERALRTIQQEKNSWTLSFLCLLKWQKWGGLPQPAAHRACSEKSGNFSCFQNTFLTCFTHF